MKELSTSIRKTHLDLNGTALLIEDVVTSIGCDLFAGRARMLSNWQEKLDRIDPSRVMSFQIPDFISLPTTDKHTKMIYALRLLKL